MCKLNKNKILCVFLILIKTTAFSQNQNFTKKELQEDLDFLKTKVLKYHPSLFSYTSKKDVEKYFTSLDAEIPNILSASDSFKVVSLFSSVIKDGHTYIEPSDKTLSRFYLNALLLPVDMYWYDKKAYLIKIIAPKLLKLDLKYTL